MNLIQSQIYQILETRYVAKYGQKLSRNHKARYFKMIESAVIENRFKVSYDKKSNLEYFYIYQNSLMGEFNEHFFHISLCFCKDDTSVRKKFYTSIKETFQIHKKEHKLKRMFLEIYADDIALKKYFSKKGELTYKLLVGNVRAAYSVLKNTKPNFQIKNASIKDLDRLVELDIEANLKNSTSRMHKILKNKKNHSGQKSFYQHMIKSKLFLVLRDKTEILGGITYFFNESIKEGYVCSLFVSHKHQGKGISKILYAEILKIFKAKKIKIFLGCSTTDKVLHFSDKIGRIEYSSAYIIE